MDIEALFDDPEFDNIVKADFEKYDKDQSGFIEVGELRTSIQELSDELEKIKAGAGGIRARLK